MKKTSSTRSLLGVAAALAFLIPAPTEGASTVTFDNQSGKPALVKLVGPTVSSVTVENSKREGVSVAPGHYFIKVRYGTPGAYSYSKSDEFDVIETATAASSISITLHNVAETATAASAITIRFHLEVVGDYGSKAIPKTEYGVTTTNATSIENSGWRIDGSRTLSSFDPPASGGKTTPAQMIKLDQAEVTQVLNLYAEISGRSIICAGGLPDIRITFCNQTPMTSVQILQALDTVLAAQGITTIYLGTLYVKVVPTKALYMEQPPIVELQPNQLPDSSSYLTYIVKLEKASGSEALNALQPFASGLPNTLIAIAPDRSSRTSAQANLAQLANRIFPTKDNNILILRDYSSNVRRMLQVLENLEQQ